MYELVSNYFVSQIDTSLSTDISVLTAEINTYKRIAREAIFEIGRRLKEVRDNSATYNFENFRDWERWCENECDISRRSANRFIQAYEELGTTSSRIPSGKVFEIIQLPANVDRSEFIATPHTIPSTGATKTVDEMTVRELREVKAALKAAEQRADKAEAGYELIRDTLESVTEKPPQVECPNSFENGGI